MAKNKIVIKETRRLPNLSAKRPEKGLKTTIPNKYIETIKLMSLAEPFSNCLTASGIADNNI